MQGSGKGTQGKYLAENFGYKIFDTGSALRGIADEGSDLGEKVKGIMNRGELVPTEVVMEVIEDFIHKSGDETPIVFDGLPRNTEQKEQFEQLMNKVNKRPIAILIDISRDLAETRLLIRKICTQCKKIFPGDYGSDTCDEENCNGNLETRSDDNPEAIEKRLDVFFEHTQPIIDQYKNEDNLLVIDGKPSIPEVSELLKNKLSFT